MSFTVTCGCQLLICLLQLLVREAAILNIFKIDFVVSEDVECQTGSLKQFGMGCVIHSNLWKPVIHLLFPVSNSCDGHFGYF